MIKSVNFRNHILKYPLIQGGMGVGVSLGQLAGHVALNHAMGVISAAHPGYRKNDFRKDSFKVNEEALKEEISKAKEIAQGNGMVAVNIMVAGNNYDKYVEAAVDGGCDAIISGAGLPLDLPALVKNSEVLLAPIVSSKKAVEVILKSWERRYQKTADFVVIESADAGGHLGFKVQDVIDKTTQTLSEILKEVKEVTMQYAQKFNCYIPVFVAGGVYNREDINRYLEEGADGVQMGTRFIATHECDASDEFKQAIIDCQEEDIQIVKSPTGFPGRALFNNFYEGIAKRGNITMAKCLDCMKPCNPQNTPYCISEALIRSVKGDTNNGVVFVGANAYRVDRLMHVSELIQELMGEVK